LSAIAAEGDCIQLRIATPTSSGPLTWVSKWASVTEL
jgi:hypothetical protein